MKLKLLRWIASKLRKYRNGIIVFSYCGALLGVIFASLALDNWYLMGVAAVMLVCALAAVADLIGWIKSLIKDYRKFEA